MYLLYTNAANKPRRSLYRYSKNNKINLYVIVKLDHLLLNEL